MRARSPAARPSTVTEHNECMPPHAPPEEHGGMNSVTEVGTRSVMALMTLGLARRSSVTLTPMDDAMAVTLVGMVGL